MLNFLKFTTRIAEFNILNRLLQHARVYLELTLIYKMQRINQICNTNIIIASMNEMRVSLENSVPRLQRACLGEHKSIKL